jgi:23S rRNA (uridine2552-2'-O)-methyltransferase
MNVTGKSRGGRVRVKTARRRTAASTRWLERQLNDPYVQAARAHGYRARSAYKLIELDAQFGLLKKIQRVVDLGAAPGGWSQVVQELYPHATIVAIDLLEMEPIVGVKMFQRNFLDDDVPDLLHAALGGDADIVLSDMAANTVGHQQTDHIRTMALCEAAVDFAATALKPGGAFVAKVFAGGADDTLLARMKKLFATVKHAKPAASRKDSSEWYVIAKGFKGKGA